MRISGTNCCLFAAGLIAAGSLLGCTQPGDSDPRHSSQPDPTAEEIEHVHAERERDRAVFEDANEADRPYDVKAYHIQADFDWEELWLDARVLIKLRLADADTGEITLDAAVHEVRRVFLAATGQRLSYHYAPDQQTLTIALPDDSPRTIRLGIDYTVDAKRSRYLHAVDRRRGDPSQARLVFTTAEPRGARHWVPCNDRPRDRARFAWTFDLPRNDKLVANGKLTQDKWEPSGEQHRVTYRTSYTIPTYLAAFAAGEFSVHEETLDGLPVQLWARQGLRMDYQRVLHSLIKSMKHYESLLGAYPFEKYALVLLPEFPYGGIEHASVTFQAELRSSLALSSGDVGLTGHELGHQWFGDHVTVRDWDDLWIKEGMATLLGAEAIRLLPGTDYDGGLLGSGFYFADGDAIYDPALPPEQKYTSGPYGRAGWLLTQIRDWMGERDFWRFMRSLLKDFASSSISTAEFLARLEQATNPGFLARVEQALIAKASPQFNFDRVELDNGDVELAIEIQDPEGAFLFAPTARISSTAGTQDVVLSVGETTQLTVPADGFLMIDPNDVHPLLFFFYDGWLAPALGDLLAPADAQQMSKFLAQPGHVHEEALWYGRASDWSLSAAEFAGFYQALGSDSARLRSLNTGCALMTADPAAHPDWAVALSDALVEPPLAGVGRSSFLSPCFDLFADPDSDPYALVWDSLRLDPSLWLWSDSLVRFVATVPLAADRALAAWRPATLEAMSLRARRMALQRLNRQLTAFDPAQQIPNDMLPVWQAAIRDAVASSDNADLLRVGLDGIRTTQDIEAIGLVAGIVRHPYLSVAYRAVCAAKAVYGDTWEVNWDEFRDLVGPTDDLHDQVRYLLSDPSSCG